MSKTARGGIVYCRLIALASKELSFSDLKKFNLSEEDLMKLILLMQKRSLTDSMTGLWNHAYFLDQLKPKVQLVLTDDYFPLSVLFFDIDKFKDFNDSYGHQAGDFVLKTIAEILKNITRDSDVVCRYGGEEFAIISEHLDRAGAFLLAEKLRLAIAEHVFAYNGIAMSCTVSIGISTLIGPGSIDADKVVTEMIEAADKRMYIAKNEKGRNAVVDGAPLVYQEPEPSNVERRGAYKVPRQSREPVGAAAR
jgi:diguanylate cyclase (GGDEF)-like protein